jgi:ribosomal protein S18 acetylase RimI-like enzyme
MTSVEPRRIEEAGLNALQTQRQLFYDGWVLRLSPGKAKRARSVNPHFGSSLPLDAKIERCEGLYAAHGLPALFRVTPFVQPAELDTALDRRGYVRFDPTLVQVAALGDEPTIRVTSEATLDAPPPAEFVEAAGMLRGSPPGQRAAHLERLSQSPLAVRALIARVDGRAVACGQIALEDHLAGVYDMVTAPDARGRGVATLLVRDLLRWARERGASHAFLQVNDDNAPALAVYRKFGFTTSYAYHYRARPHECR